ncbi:MAG: zinc ribbon domain-containing protein [Phycisphaeraceae bacterium]|nr:zinc ribbon domain-containing protein [Phycisphaeraceae bacterium]
MPTYAYKCDSCEHDFELFQSITAEPVKKCPECKKAKVRRLIGTGAGIIFKGSGFYETDYRSASYKKAAEKDSKKPETKSSDKKDSTSESKKTKATPTPKADTKK